MTTTPADPVDGAARVSWPLAYCAIAGLGCMFLLDLATAFGDALRLIGVGAFGDARDQGLVELAILIRGGSAAAQLLVLIPLVVVFCMWTYRSAINARALGAGGFEITPGWAVGWHFIPLANLWMPYKAMSEIWRSSRADQPEPIPGTWQDSRAGILLVSWWGVWILGRALNAVGRPLSQTDNGELVGAWLFPFGALFESLAALLCIVVVYRLTSRQAELAVRAATEDHPHHV